MLCNWARVKGVSALSFSGRSGRPRIIGDSAAANGTSRRGGTFLHQRAASALSHAGRGAGRVLPAPRGVGQEAGSTGGGSMRAACGQACGQGVYATHTPPLLWSPIPSHASCILLLRLAAHDALMVLRRRAVWLGLDLLCLEQAFHSFAKGLFNAGRFCLRVAGKHGWRVGIGGLEV
jgi:hypothetical protein